MIPMQKILTCLFLLALTMMCVESAFSEPDSENNYVPPTVITPDNLSWYPFSAFPPGAKIALLSGDPREAGPFVIRLKIPANYKVQPNWQTIKIYVTVISGSYHIGVGNKFNPKSGKTLPSTGSVVIPANSHLYFWSDKGAILEIHGIGPWDINYVNQADDPRNSQ